MKYANAEECFNAHAKRPWVAGLQNQRDIWSCFKNTQTDDSVCGSSTWCAFADSEPKHEYASAIECLLAHEMPNPGQ